MSNSVVNIASPYYQRGT